MRLSTLALGAALLGAVPAVAATFIPGNLVIATSGSGVWGAASGGYTDNQASPLTLVQFTTGGAYVNSTVLPTTGSGAISAEYGSSSEGLLHLTGDGTALTVMGYGVAASDFNANPTAFGTTTTGSTKVTALAQSGSLIGQGYIAVPRVAAIIGADGSVDTSTRLYNVFNGNNARAVTTLDGKTLYVSGQGVKGDATGGVFVANRGSTSATAVTGLDTSGKTASQDTRDVQIVNGQLVVSVDSKGGSNNARDFIGTLGARGALPIGLANDGNGPTMLSGYGNSGGTGKVTLSSLTANGIAMAGHVINLSPESFFFANSTTLYVADTGAPKNDSALKDKNGIGLGNGGLQKWTYANGAWSLAYTVSAGLNLVANSATAGTTGLFGLTGMVIGDQVQLFATNYTVGDLDQTYLFGLTDSLSRTTPATGEVFQTLATAPAGSNFKGVSFAPTAAPAVPEPTTYATMILGVGFVGGAIRRRNRTAWAEAPSA
jgi:hypothetical protein